MPRSVVEVKKIIGPAALYVRNHLALNNLKRYDSKAFEAAVQERLKSKDCLCMKVLESLNELIEHV